MLYCHFSMMGRFRRQRLRISYGLFFGSTIAPPCCVLTPFVSTVKTFDLVRDPSYDDPCEDDGNCLFKAVAKSGKVSTDCHVTLRRQTWLSAKRAYERNDTNAVKIFNALGPGNGDFESIFQTLSKAGSWTSYLDVCFLALFCNVHVITVSNEPTNFAAKDTNEIFHFLLGDEMTITSNALTIYHYHHFFRSPFDATNRPNHFTLLVRTTTTDYRKPFLGGYVRVELQDLPSTNRS